MNSLKILRPRLAPRRRGYLPALLLSALVWLACCPPARGQWLAQTIELNPGWNAVFLDANPEPRECEAAFKGLPVESVWMWNGRAGAPQFIQDPRNLTPAAPDWLVYVPASAEAKFASTLFSLVGGRGYLIKVSGAQKARWTFAGSPRLEKFQWTPNAFNFAGFPAAAANPLNFQRLLAESPAVAAQAVYELDPAGAWRLVDAPAARPVSRGRAYWVFAREAARYSAPLEVEPEFGSGLDFGSQGVTAKLRLRNLSAETRAITLRPRVSDTPPPGAPAALAGPAPLSYFKRDLAAKIEAWLPLGDSLEVRLGPRESTEVEFAIRRQDLAPFRAPAGFENARYQSLIEVSDGAGVMIVVPVAADLSSAPPSAPASPARARLSSAPANAGSPFAGLWTGLVTVNAVNEPRHPAQPRQPMPTASEFQFRVLVHLDNAGRARLLREALVMFKEGALKPIQDSPLREVDSPGSYVILTDDSLLARATPEGKPLFTGAAFVDGVKVGRRISTANLSLEQPAPFTLSGAFGEAGTKLTCSIPIRFDNRLHPFRHAYHPDHDNKDREFRPRANPNDELWDIQRALTFEFTREDPNNTGSPSAGFGASVLAGIYRETVTGLHKDPIHAQGVFRLSRILPIAELDDGLERRAPNQAR